MASYDSAPVRRIFRLTLPQGRAFSVDDYEPLEFLERLAAMTPRSETNLLICHGVLAPRARWRGRVVVYGRPVPEPTASMPSLAAGPDGMGVKAASRAPGAGRS